MKLSIIICVYNTPKKYLEECLESITSSTVKVLGDEYEIVMVDDGSSEDYSALTDKYGVRVTKTENRGIFSARRTGALMARGKYSIYCDSDDTVSFNYYLPMLLMAEGKAADIVINDWATHTSRARYYATTDETIRSELDLSGEEILLAFLKNEGRQHAFYVLWNKLYKTSILLSAFEALERAGFDESSSYSEDAAINFFIWKDAKRAVNLHTGYYFYRIHDSQTVAVTSEDKLKKQICSMAKTLDIMRNNIGDNKHKEKLISHIDAWAAMMSRAHYSQAKGQNYTELFPLIKGAYRVEKLRLSTVKDGKAYENKALLGDNFTEVDSALLKIHDSEASVRVTYCRKDPYTDRSVSYLKMLDKLTDSEDAEEITVPRFIIPLKKKLLHNSFLYKLGLVFFKKGSRARNFLKKFI